MRSKQILLAVALAVASCTGPSLFAEDAPKPPFLVLQTSGSPDSVGSVAVSPDGSLLATASGPIRIHDARTGALLRVIGSDLDLGIRTVVFSPDGRTLASAGFHMDKLARLWDVNTGKQLRTFAGHTELLANAVAFSPDGKLLASAGTDKQILVWDVATGAIRHQLAGLPSPVTALAFSPDGAVLASGGGEKTIRLWDIETGRVRKSLAGHRNWVVTLAFSADGQTLASGDCDWDFHRGNNPARFAGLDPGYKSQWKLWDVATGEVQRTVTEPARLLSLSLSPDGASLVCGAGNDVRLYELKSDDPGRVVTSHAGGTNGVAFARDGAAVFSASHDRALRRLALPEGKVEWNVPGYWEQVNSVALSADGSLIATGSSDLRFAERAQKMGATHLGPGAVRLWNARTGRLLRRLGDPAEQVMAVAVSPDGRWVAGGGGRLDGSGMVHLWDTSTGEEAWSKPDHGALVLAVAFAPDGSSLATAGLDGAVKVRDPKSGVALQAFEGLGKGAASVAYSADGAVLVGGAVDGESRFWNVRTGALIRSIRPPLSLPRIILGGERELACVALSPNGETLATCSLSPVSHANDNLVRVWDARTGKLSRELRSEQTGCRFVAISPDGTTLATNGTGKAIHLWNLTTGELLHALQGHQHPPRSAVFSADGRTLVSGGDYRTTLVWDVAAGRLLATLCTFSESHPGTTEDDWLAYTPDGFYDGSPGIDRYLAWRVGDDLLTADTLGPRLHQKERVEAALAIPDRKTVR